MATTGTIQNLPQNSQICVPFLVPSFCDSVPGFWDSVQECSTWHWLLIQLWAWIYAVQRQWLLKLEMHNFTSDIEFVKTKFELCGKFMLESSFQHFMESCFTSVLCHEFLFMPNSHNLFNLHKNKQNHEKIGRIVIHKVHSSCKKWIEKSRLHLIQVNFDHDPSLSK